MIPYAILAGQYFEKDSNIATEDFRILELSPETFIFRTAEPLVHPEEGEFLLHFFSFRGQRWENVCLKPENFTIQEAEASAEAAEAFYTTYRVKTSFRDFEEKAAKLSAEYLHYISLKWEGDDAALSQALTGYPAELEGRFADCWEQQKEELFSNLQAESGWQEAYESFPRLALQLDRPSLWQAYLHQPLREFMRAYWKQNNLEKHPIRHRLPDSLCIGNQFCRHLFPKKEELAAIRRKAQEEGLQILLYLSPTAEEQMEERKHFLREQARMAADKEEKTELVINDLGLLHFLQEELPGSFVITLGSLLNKYRRDVRMQWKKGYDRNQKSENAFSTDFYPARLCGIGAAGWLLEASAPLPKISAEGKSSLIFPFYQMNTAGYCTLYAACKNLSRGRQEYVKSCPGYCEGNCFLYPQALGMVGRYNTLFGFHAKILQRADLLREMREEKVERLILQLL